MTATSKDSAIGDSTRRLYDEALVWDMVFVYEPEMDNDYRLFPRWIASGVDFVSVHPAGDNHNIGEAMRRIGRLRSHLRGDKSGKLILAESVEDILRAKAEGKLAVGIHLEGFRCLERDLNLIEIYYKLGVRFCHPIFNLVNSIGGGCADRIDIGLTNFGLKVIREMNRVGMLVDGAHAGYRTTLDMMEHSEAPVVFSHLGCYSVREHFRNVRDDQIRKCAGRGGMVGITSAGFYLGGLDAETYFRHVDHVAQLVGAEYVGIGMDSMDRPELLQAYIDARPDEWPGREQGLWKPMGFIRPEQLIEVAELMVRRGYPEKAVRGVLGENWLRVCKAVWK
jgi:membrane dipeptidase